MKYPVYPLVLGYPLSSKQRLCSDCRDEQANLSLCWVHMWLCRFCHARGSIIYVLKVVIIISDSFSWFPCHLESTVYCLQIFFFCEYHKFPKYLDTQKICCNHSKIWTMWLYHTVMSPNDAERMANSVDPDQTAPLGAVWSGSALFAQAYLSENLGSLR